MRTARFRPARQRSALLVALALVICAGSLGAAETNADTPLGIRQGGVKFQVQDLERKLMRLIQLLREAEPEQAQHLARALKHSKQAMIESKMGAIVELLNKKALAEARKNQDQVTKELLALLTLLMEETNELEKLKQKIEMLEGWRDKLSLLEKEEWDEKRESEKVSAKGENIALFKSLAQGLAPLIGQQQELIDETARALASGAQDMPRIGARQNRVFDKLDTAMRKLVGNAGLDDVSSSALAQQSEPGLRALIKAAKLMTAAAGNLLDGKVKSAEQDQRQARDKLREAADRLQWEAERLATLPADHYRQMTKAQDATAAKTADLAREMSAAPDGPQPGFEHLEPARLYMVGASGKLGKPAIGSAIPLQEKALEQLRLAKKKLDEAIAAAKGEMKNLLLEELQGMFYEMLERQKLVTQDTGYLDTKKRKAPWTRVERLRCIRVAVEQKAIAGLAGEALTMIAEDGKKSAENMEAPAGQPGGEGGEGGEGGATAVVFLEVVKKLQEDMLTVHGWLAAGNTASLTQELEKEIEATLEDLINALDVDPDAEAGEDEPPEDEGEGQEPPLVSILAELKLLRALQVRTNRSTKRLEKLRLEKGLEPALKQQLKAITGRQAKILKMARELTRR